MSDAVLQTEEATLRQSFIQVCQEVGGWPLPGQGATRRRLELRELFSGWTSRWVAWSRHTQMRWRFCPSSVRTASPIRVRASDVVGVSGRPVRPKEWWRPVMPMSGGCRAPKNWCSGAGLVTHALVDASSDDGQRLFGVDLSDPGVAWARQDWVGPGMQRVDTRGAEFLNVAATAIGEPGQYLSRPGFWSGRSEWPLVGTAAQWRSPKHYGGQSEGNPTPMCSSTSAPSTRRSFRTGRHSEKRGGP